MVHNNRIRVIRPKLKQRKFYLNVRENFFALRVTEHQNRLSREVMESPSLEKLKPGHDPVQRALVDPVLTAELD